MASESILLHPDSSHLVELTFRAFHAAREACAAVADGIATASAPAMRKVRELEKELDTLDRDIDDLVTTTISKVDERHARELLACMKFAIALERIGDLLLNFSNRAEAVAARLDLHDSKDLTQMASRLEQMVTAAENAFRTRNLEGAINVLRSDAELDRLCNVIMFRHLEPTGSERRLESFHVLFMAQELERSGDHVKNIAEEICHLVSGRPVRHVLRSYDRPVEQMFLDHMRKQSL